MEATSRIDTRDQVRAVVEPTIEAEGFRLIAVEITGDTHGDIVRLYCDSPDFGVDDCAKISRTLAPLLDVEDPMTAARVVDGEEGGGLALAASVDGEDRGVAQAGHAESPIGMACPQGRRTR